MRKFYFQTYLIQLLSNISFVLPNNLKVSLLYFANVMAVIKAIFEFYFFLHILKEKVVGNLEI